MTTRLSRFVAAAGAAVVLLGSGLTALPANAAPAPVRMVSREQKTSTSNVRRQRTVVTAITGVSTAVSRRITADLNSRTLAFMTVPKGFPGPFDLQDKLMLVRADAHFVTFVQHTNLYLGGAHGQGATWPVTYSRGSGTLLGLRQFVVPGQEAALLRALSTECRKILASRGMDPGFYRDNTTPRYENFAQFQPLPNGWQVEFAQSAVAPSAAGLVSVLVPWSALKGLIGVPLPIG